MEPLSVVLLVVLVAVTVAALTALVLRRAAGFAGARPAPEAPGSVEVRRDLDRLTTLVQGLAERQANQHGEVAATLSRTLEATAGLSSTTGRLQRALANPTARGQWGERMAEDVLAASGLVRGINYRCQTPLANGSIPDVTFLLPGGLVLHMDVKFPLDNYLRAVDATTPAERRAAEQAFLKDVRLRIKELTGRGYIEPGVTVDHLLAFIPNEAVYSFIHERDPEIANLALRHGVVLCSPFTLFAVLGVVRQAVRAVDLQATSDEILDVLDGFEHQWERYCEAVDVVAKRMASTQRAFDDLTGTRRRQLDRQLARLDRVREDEDGEGVGSETPRSLAG